MKLDPCITYNIKQPKNEILIESRPTDLKGKRGWKAGGKGIREKGEGA